MLLSVLSIFAITLCVLSLQRLLPLSRCVMALCALCAGVSLTWIGLLLAHFAGYPIDIRVPAILMGGSVVGIAYQAGRFLPMTRSELVWKLIFIPFGFALVFTILDHTWMMMWIMLSVVAAIVLWSFLPWFTARPHTHDERIASLEQKMKKCC